MAPNTIHPVVIESVILRIEGPDLVLARDAIGTAFICSLTSRGRSGDHFVAVRVSNQRVLDLRTGRIDVRTALTEPEMGPFFQGPYRRIDGEPNILLLETHEFPEEWLPAEDLFVTDFEEEVEEGEALRLASLRNRTAIICRLDPPEARGLSSKINADRLADWIANFQQLIRQVIAKSVNLLDPEAGVLQVLAMPAGSFQIQFETAEKQANLFNHSAVGDAMRQVDALLDVLDKPAEEILRVAQQNKGLVIGAYRELLEFAGDQNSPVEYRWAEPGMTQEAFRRIEPRLAKAVCAVLDTREDLGSETVSFIGYFTKVDVKRRTWAATEPETGRNKYGSLHDDSPDLLNGVVVKDKLYQFGCDARLERTADGRSTMKLILRSLGRLQNSR